MTAIFAIWCIMTKDRYDIVEKTDSEFRILEDNFIPVIERDEILVYKGSSEEVGIMCQSLHALKGVCENSYELANGLMEAIKSVYDTAPDKDVFVATLLADIIIEFDVEEE